MNRSNLASGYLLPFVSVFVSVCMSCIGRAAPAGPYADGVLLLHGSALGASSDPTDYQVFHR